MKQLFLSIFFALLFLLVVKDNRPIYVISADPMKIVIPTIDHEIITLEGADLLPTPIEAANELKDKSAWIRRKGCLDEHISCFSEHFRF